MTTISPDALEERIRRVKLRHEATKMELERFEDLCRADEKKCCSEYSDGRDESYTSATTTSSSATSVIPEGLRLPRGKNKSFSASEVRDIERKNAILMSRIASHNRKPSQYRMDPGYFTKVSNSQVNRKKMQQQIERENMVNTIR